MSTKKRTTFFTTDKILSPKIKWHDDSKLCLVFKGSCLKWKNATYTPPNRINVFVVYELGTWSWDIPPDFTLKDCLFGDVKLAKKADPNKYVYSGFGIGFDSHSLFSLPNFHCGKNVFILGVYMSSSLHIDKKKKRYLNSWKRSNRMIRWYYVDSKSSTFN